MEKYFTQRNSNFQTSDNNNVGSNSTGHTKSGVGLCSCLVLLTPPEPLIPKLISTAASTQPIQPICSHCNRRPSPPPPLLPLPACCAVLHPDCMGLLCFKTLALPCPALPQAPAELTTSDLSFLFHSFCSTYQVCPCHECFAKDPCRRHLYRCVLAQQRL